ncbi:MAG: hypothetical protein MHM6MM_005203 [Cercozoa sp. M6MM]
MEDDLTRRLYDAVKTGNHQSVAVLLEMGAPVNGIPHRRSVLEKLRRTPTAFVWSPLEAAVTAENVDCLLMLKQHGADVNVRICIDEGNEGERELGLLSYAFERLTVHSVLKRRDGRRLMEIIRLLIEAGSQVPDKITVPTRAALRQSDLAQLVLLRSSQSSLTFKGHELGWNVLHWSVVRRCLPLTHMLTSDFLPGEGTRKQIPRSLLFERDKQNRTPLCLAKHIGDVNTAALLADAERREYFRLLFVTLEHECFVKRCCQRVDKSRVGDSEDTVVIPRSSYRAARRKKRRFRSRLSFWRRNSHLEKSTGTSTCALDSSSSLNCIEEKPASRPSLAAMEALRRAHDQQVAALIAEIVVQFLSLPH